MHAVVDEQLLQLRRLPLPDPDALQHSLRVALAIAEIIKTHGPISFAQYMDLALYAPGLGYYCAGTEKFGSTGDFTTAPEISPLFAEALANFCVQNFSKKIILEIGAGSGRLALNLMRALDARQQLPDHYYILEMSPDLQQRQRELIATEAPEFLARFEWLDRLPEKKIEGVIIANEVLDAMPVNIFTAKNQGYLEKVINVVDEKFVWEEREPTSELATAIDELSIDFSSGYTSEINLNIKPWINSLAEVLGKGAILLIDYGFLRQEYYHSDRSMGTLMCHYQHRAHTDPLILPGIQDITAHVDFTAVGKAAEAANLQVSYYGTQAQFLLQYDILGAMQSLAKTPAQHLQLANQVKLLTLPSEMGELFKAMILTKV